MGKSYSVVCKCNSKEDESNTEEVYNANASISNFDHQLNEKNNKDKFNNIQSANYRFLNDKGNKIIEQEVDEFGTFRDSNTINTKIQDGKHVEFIGSSKAGNGLNSKDQNQTLNSRLNINLKPDDPDFHVNSSKMSNNSPENEKSRATKRQENKIKYSKNNMSYISSRKDNELSLHQFIDEEMLERYNEFEVLYQGDLLKYNFKISANFSHNVSYSSRFCIFTKKDIRLYKSKESFLHLFPHLISIETAKINYTSKININTKKGYYHFSIVYDYPECFENPVFNEYFSSKDQSIVFKDIAKENKFYLEHKNFKLFCDHLIILASPNAEEVERWMAIFRYCIKNN